MYFRICAVTRTNTGMNALEVRPGARPQVGELDRVGLV
jgi:hypothetical protein